MASPNVVMRKDDTAQRTPAAPALDADLAKRLLHDMMLIRRFEEKAAEIYALGKIGGFLHLSIGEEAVAAGATSVLRPDDYAISTYREHGHCLAKGSDPRRVMAELFGRRDGFSKGKGGSMHLFDKSANFLGGHAIVGAHLPLAAGVGFAIKYQGGDQVIVCATSATARSPKGEFHESMNLAARSGSCRSSSSARTTATRWAPPSSARSPRPRSTSSGAATTCRASRSTAWTCSPSARSSAARSSGRGATRRPSLIEARTYRFRGHSMRDPAGAVYRTKEEVEREKLRDPIVLLRDRALREGTSHRRGRADDREGRQRPGRRGGRLRRCVAGAAGRVALHRHLQGELTMAVMTYREALNLALREEMHRDPRVFVMGEEVGLYEGAYKVTQGLLKEFGPKRIVDTPIAESGFTGVGIGAAMVGLRPVVEMMTFNFALLALDQIVNSAAKMNYMSGGQYNIPIVIRGPGGPAHQLAAQHSQSMEAYFYHVPGLKVVRPSTPADAKGLLKSAIRDDNPVIFIESETLYAVKGEVPDDPEFLIPLGQAVVRREGTDVTVVAYMGMMYRAMEAAEELAKDGISVEIVDPRTLRPMDTATIIGSVRKTHRAVVVEAGAGFAGMGSEIAAFITEQAFDDLDAPVERVTGANAPMPYARNLEKLKTPTKEKIIDAVRRVCNANGS